MDLDSTNNHDLQTLIDLAAKQGGMVLRVGSESKAVVLSIDKYNELLTKQDSKEYPEKSKTILVTGGAGYIGSHTAQRLLAAGHEVIVIDNLSTGRREFVSDKTIFYEGDVGDRRLLDRIFTEHHIDAVMHFAASLEVAESVEQPDKYFDNNVSRTIILLRAMADAGVKQINFSSTAAVYGNQDRVPIPETAELQPNNPYGMSKLLGEHIIRYFAECTGMRATILRYFNVCGAEPEGRLGDTHINSHLIPIVLEVAKGIRKQLVINGNDYDTFDGTCVRDYVHVQDIAEAHALALHHPENASSFRVYNVGTGKGLSVEQVVTAVAEILGKMIPIEIGPRRAGDAVATVADAKKIQAELGFAPRYSDIENVIKTSWNRLGK